MTSALSRLSGSAFELTLTVPWSDVKKIYDQVFDELAGQIELPGFRKGTAPKNLVADKVDKSKVYGEVVNRVLPEAYQKALSEHNLKPIVSPKVQIAAADEDKDWQFIAKAAEKPTVELDDYKKYVAEINSKNKIWTPDKGKSEEVKEDDKSKEEEKSKKVSGIIDKLLEVCRVELAELLLESEVNRLITQLIEDVRQAGLTYEQYLQSSSQTADQIRDKYRHQAEAALKLEFILEAVADDLKVEVSKEEIEAIIDKETNPEKKKALQDQSYLLASILRRENTITKLLTL